MKQMLRRLFACLLCVVLLSAMPVAADAAAPTTLRVAFYPLEGFFEYDSQGNEVGYGVELLDRISRYTGIQFTYVPAESWEITKSMLLDGEADIRMPGTMPSTPSETLGYTQHSILDTYYAVLTLKSRDDLVYEDYDAFQTLKIAVSQNLYDTTQIENYLADMNLTDDNLVFCDGYNACRAALDAGEVDALISNIMDLDQDMKLLERFSSRSNYISMTIGNEYLDVLDEAIYAITAEDSSFFSNLYLKWFPERAITPFTKEELAYLSGVDHLSFYFCEHQGYLSEKQADGSYQGICPTLAQELCERLGVAYRQCDADTAFDEVTVIVPDFYYEFAWADQYDSAITGPYSDASYYEIAKKGSDVDESTARVAAIKDYRITQEYVEKGYAPEQMVWCEDYAACIKAVDDGTADLTYVNRYAAEYYLGLYRYSSLSATLTDYSHQVCCAVMGQDKELLASIINKCLTSISSDDYNAIVVQETSVTPKQDFLVESYYQDPLRSTLYACSAVAVLLVILGYSYSVRKTRRQNLLLQQAVSAKQDFLSRISHDIRTPMNAIIGFSHFGEESDSLEQSRAYHKKVSDASGYLLQLINDTLDLSKLESGTMSIFPEPYSSAEFIETITNILMPKAQEKGIEFTIDNSLSNPKIAMFDKLRLQQIIINLLNNAMKFTPAGGHVTLKIDVQTGEGDELVSSFSVIDDGMGMTEAFQKEMLYKPFVQEHRIENSESGTGLGLSIVKALVDAMGGTIHCESAPGEGTTFTVTLKTKSVEETPDEKRLQPPTAELSGRRILLAEDHPLNVEIAKRLLESKGVTVDVAMNGREAVERFQSAAPHYYDAILMDIRMPEMDGLEAAQAIRALERPDAKAVPIVAMTANALDDDTQKSMDAGMNAHLAKPVQPQRLYDLLAELTADGKNL